MGAAPTVSVITPAFNAARSIERALRSALAQTLTALEVIVVDDASGDDTVDRVEALQRQDRRIVLKRHPRNLGPGAARNTALDSARGVWVTPLDADDEMAPERLERLLGEAERRSADFMADNLVFDHTGEAGSPPEHPWPPAFLERAQPVTASEFIDTDMPRNGVSSLGYLKPLMRREFLLRHELRYDPDLRGPEDSNLYLSALIAGARFCTTGWAGYRYHRYEGSMSRGRSREWILRNLEHAIESNRRLERRAARTGAPDTLERLRRQRERLEVVRWLDRVRLAGSARRWRDLPQLLLPPHPLALARYVVERLRSGPQRNLPTEPARPR